MPEPGRRLRSDVVGEVDTFAERMEHFVSKMERDRRSETLRARHVSELMIDFLGMIDTVDHGTSGDGAGTQEIQSFLHAGRIAAREFADKFPRAD